MIRVFVVEDEPPALRKVKRLLATEHDLILCGSAGSCAEAIPEIRRIQPDLLLLDIHLPDGSGFEILQGISDLQQIQPLFLTALDNHALEAFEVAAIDYLVKPVAQERFSQAIQRARERFRKSVSAIVPTYTGRFLVERLRLAYMLSVDSIEWIGADRNYARLFSTKGEFALWIGCNVSLIPQCSPASAGTLSCDWMRSRSYVCKPMDAISRVSRAVPMCHVPRHFGNPLNSPEHSCYSCAITRSIACAVPRHGFPAGANPARQLSLRPVAIGAAVEARKRLKPPV